MLDRKYFQRNADGTLKTKKPCPNGDYPTEHVCLIGTENNWRAAMRKAVPRGRGAGWSMDEGHRQNIAAAQRARFAARNAQTVDRDLEVLNRRDDGVYIQDIANEFGITVGKVNYILSRREELRAL